MRGWRAPTLAWMLAGLAAFGLYGWARARSNVMVVARSELPLRTATALGDVLVIAPGSRVELTGPRSVRLLDGALLLEVMPRRGRVALSVDTPHGALVCERGLFRVELPLARSVAHVYEGVVKVGGRAVGAGEGWASEGRPDGGGGILHEEARCMRAAPTPAAPATSPRAAAPELRTDEALAAVRRAAPEDALALLDAGRLDDDGSVVRDEAALLRIDALLALGRRSAARVYALRQLGRAPQGPENARLRALVAAP